MPDDIIISELSNAPQIDDSAVFPLTQDNGGSPATFKATMSQIAGKIGEGTTFANLQTTSKTLVGAINEAAQGGGGGIGNIISTASGSIATFADGGNGIPLKSCEVEIVAQQASGTPSPSNPLIITGFSSIDVSVSNGVDTPTVHTVSLGQTIYGGTAELVGGNGYLTHICLNFSDIDFGQASSPTNHIFRGNYSGAFYSNIKFPPNASTPTTAITEHYAAMGYTPISASDNGKFALQDFETFARFVIIDNNFSTQADFETARNNDKIIIPLKNPIPITFTGANIPTLSGVNNVYADSGDIQSLEYFNENADEIAELINVYPYEVSGVLTAGQTSITLSSGLIKADSTIDVYTDNDVDYNSVSVSSGSITITFDEQASNLGVKVRLS